MDETNEMIKAPVKGDATKAPYWTCKHCGTITWSEGALERHMCSWKEADIKMKEFQAKEREISLLMQELLESAWGIIANVSGGEWSKQTLPWVNATVRWRDKYHGYLDLTKITLPGEEEIDEPQVEDVLAGLIEDIT